MMISGIYPLVSSNMAKSGEISERAAQSFDGKIIELNHRIQHSQLSHHKINLGMDQYLLIPFLGGWIACMSPQLQRNLAHTISIYLSYTFHQKLHCPPNGPQFYFLWPGHPALLRLWPVNSSLKNFWLVQSFCHVKCPFFFRHWCLHFSCLHQIVFNIPSRNKPSIPPCLPVFSPDWPLTSLAHAATRKASWLERVKKWARGAISCGHFAASAAVKWSQAKDLSPAKNQWLNCRNCTEPGVTKKSSNSSRETCTEPTDPGAGQVI